MLLKSLSTEDLFVGLRFVVRRERPVRVYSYQCTNPNGAVNLFENINWDKVFEYSDVD